MIRVMMRRTVRPAQYESMELSVEVDTDAGITGPEDSAQIATNKLRYFAFKQVMLFEMQSGVRDSRSVQTALREFKAQMRLNAGDVDPIAPADLKSAESTA